MAQYIDMSQNQIERNRQLRESNDEVIPFEELSVLFLDYLKSQECSMIIKKCNQILRQLKLCIDIMLVYYILVTIFCSCAIYYDQEIFVSVSFGGLMNSLFCIHLCVCVKKQKKYICKKSTMTRKLILLFLIEEIKEGINQNRIRLYIYDQNIAVKLNWKLFLKELLGYQIGIPIYLIFSYILMNIGPTQYLLSILREEIQINYLSLISAIIVISIMYLLIGILVFSIIGFSIFGIYKLIQMILVLLFRIVISVPFVWLFCLRYWQKKQILKIRLAQFQRVRDIENEQCSICLLSMGNALELNCDHRFHDQCLSEWLKGHNNCPICRIQV